MKGREWDRRFESGLLQQRVMRTRDLKADRGGEVAVGRRDQS